MAFRICTKDFQNNVERVVNTPAYLSYEAAMKELKKRGGADPILDDKGEPTGQDIVHFPFTIRTQREVKPLIMANRFTTWDRLFVPISQIGRSKQKTTSETAKAA